MSRIWETERAVLGACLLAGPELYEELSPLLDESDFARPQHGFLWSLLGQRVAQGEQIDLLSVVASLPDDASRFDGVAYVASLPNAAPSVEGAPGWARTVARAAHTRRLRDLCAATVETIGLQGDTADPNALALGLEHALGELGQRAAVQQSPWATLGEAAMRTHQQIVEMARDPEARQRRTLASPWPGLDRCLGGGLNRGEMGVLAGRPGTFKSAAAMQWAAAASRMGAVLVVSLEMTERGLTSRELARDAAVPIDRLMSGQGLQAADWRALTRSVEEMQNVPLHLCTLPGLTIARIAGLVRQKVRALRARGQDVVMVMVDYLQLVATTATARSTGDKAVQIAEISIGLAGLAKTCDVGVLAVAQMNREMEKRASNRPRLSDLDGSGQIEKDASFVVFTSFPEDLEELEDDPNARELVVEKARWGPRGVVRCLADGVRTRLLERDLRPEPPAYRATWHDQEHR